MVIVPSVILAKSRAKILKSTVMTVNPLIFISLSNQTSKMWA
jgi:hypothetical protein